MGNVLSNEYYDQLVETLGEGKKVAEVHFTLDQLPQVNAGDPPVRLVSISHPDHVNAICSDRPLTFEANGLTLIYGDNASGKSGYARLLKRIARARHQEEVLTDVFRDSALAKPTAALTVRVGDQEMPLTWPESNPPELKRMLFYDEVCGRLYIDMEADFPYRPSALFVMDDLINACGAIRSRIDAKLEENSKLAKPLPVVDEEVKDAEAGKYVAQISATSSLEVLDAILKKLDAPQ
jgi:energy-coupling factor transporter ATP-binding protein EcfA2